MPVLQVGVRTPSVSVNCLVCRVKFARENEEAWKRGVPSSRIRNQLLMSPASVTRLLSLVPKAGLEPARLAPHAPQTCVSAISPLRLPAGC